VSHLFSKETRVLVVEPNSSARKLIGDCVKQAGLENVQSMDSIKNALGFLEVETADWLIAPLMKEEDINLFHLLDVLQKNPGLKHIATSVFADKGDMGLVPAAFGYGAISWHPRNFTKDAVKAEFDALKKNLTTHKDNRLSTSAEYYHQAAVAGGKTHLLAPFYGKLTREFEDDENYRTKETEALFESKQIDLGKSSVSKMKLLGMSAWQALAQKYLPGEEVPGQALPLKKVLIVDPDEMTAKQAGEVLKKNGVQEVIHAADGNKAVEVLQSNELDFIFQEWKIPGLSGPAFLQRVRHAGHVRVPIVVLSSLPGAKDVNLLSELGVARLLPKPFKDTELQSAFMEILQEEVKPSGVEALERKLREALALGELERAESYLRRYLGLKSLSEGKKLYARALLMFHMGKVTEAGVLIKEALKKGGEALHCSYLLGRILVQKRDFVGAVKCFEKAQEHAPKNIERLCELTEALVQSGNEQAADAKLEEAKALDSGNEKVMNQEAKMSLADNDIEKARDLIMHMGSLKSFVSDLNNSAVAHTRSGHFDKGMELYSRCVKALPESETELRLRVSYNHALALARRRDYKGSLEVLDSLSPDVTLPVAVKIESLQKKLKKILKDGGQLGIEVEESAAEVLASVDPTSTVEGEPGVDNVLKELEAQQGGSTCSRFVSLAPADVAELQALLKNPPKFKPRKALERAEGMGIERMM
jgi:DNA-binding response OmpR family regulator